MSILFYFINSFVHVQFFQIDQDGRPLENIENDFEDRGDVIIDHTTRLMWQKEQGEFASFKDTQKYIQEINQKGFAGYNNWRLPTIPELLSLVEPEKKPNKVNLELYINPIFIERRHTTYYWSADEGDWGAAWTVDFLSGEVRWRNGLHLPSLARCVRSFNE